MKSRRGSGSKGNGSPQHLQPRRPWRRRQQQQDQQLRDPPGLWGRTVAELLLVLFGVAATARVTVMILRLPQQQPLPKGDGKQTSAAVGTSYPIRAVGGNQYNMSRVRFATHHVLDVPFYVYEDLAWEDATVDGVPIHESVVRHHLTDNNKHTDDYWFMLAALRHPMRTLDPAEAKLFVVPPLLNCYEVRRLVEGKTAYQNTV